MEFTSLGLIGAYHVGPHKFPDVRGHFFESVRATSLATATGEKFEVRQVNFSVSKRNTVRGIHHTELPPGQVKFVTCVRGAALDVAVDLRVDSPTFGRHAMVRQSAHDGGAVFLADGIGHAFQALTDDTCMLYLCSQEYQPGTMRYVDPFDPAIGIPWELTDRPIRSDADRDAPSLAEARQAGLLPTVAQAARRVSCSRVL